MGSERERSGVGEMGSETDRLTGRQTERRRERERQKDRQTDLAGVNTTSRESGTQLGVRVGEAGT